MVYISGSNRNPLIQQAKQKSNQENYSSTKLNKAFMGEKEITPMIQKGIFKQQAKQKVVIRSILYLYSFREAERRFSFFSGEEEQTSIRSFQLQAKTKTEPGCSSAKRTHAFASFLEKKNISQ
jgi:hypothetical protein